MTQAEALAILKTGANVFLTGEPGSGKTHTINQYVAYLRSAGVEPAITASTGIAATHIGGRTIHSWSGIGIRPSLNKYDLDRIGQNRTVFRRVSAARVLIIDEVSMLAAGTLAMVEAVCREVRQSDQPFGGLQVVLVGDFFQLPPVSKPGGRSGDQFAFCSPVWDALNPIVCYLAEQHRQADAKFLGLLAAIRANAFTEDHRQILRGRYAKEPPGKVTELYSHNADVDKINADQLSELAGELKQFEMTGEGSEKLVIVLKAGCLSPETLELKVGARVMFTKNDLTERRYVNGTLGTVSGFAPVSGFPIVKTAAGQVVAEPDDWRVEENGRQLAKITQVPLRLAWAITVHKSQGLSLDAAHMDLSKVFEYGQGYVALSRVRTLGGLSLAGLNDRALEVHPTIRVKDSEFKNQSDLARAKFGELEPAALELMHANFVRACGGRLGSGRRVKKAKVAGATYEETKKLVAEKLSLKEIAKKRGVTVGTIIGHWKSWRRQKRLSQRATWRTSNAIKKSLS